ncbi:hypothetical protein [Nostoc sp.]|uniref:hypothetical protein n=1 Tax=Nostoc sp. TaxID=1180 RepID=UPI002FFAEDDE
MRYRGLFLDIHGRYQGKDKHLILRRADWLVVRSDRSTGQYDGQSRQVQAALPDQRSSQYQRSQNRTQKPLLSS